MNQNRYRVWVQGDRATNRVVTARDEETARKQFAQLLRHENDDAKWTQGMNPWAFGCARLGDGNGR